MKSYLDLLYKCLIHGKEHHDRTGVGTHRLHGQSLHHDLRDGFPLLTTKRMPLRTIDGELKWIVSGSRWEADVGSSIWAAWATHEKCSVFGRNAGNLGPTYGPMLRRFPVGITEDDPHGLPPVCVDQLAELMYELEENPDSRRLLISLWHPYYQQRCTVPPCSVLYQLHASHADSDLSMTVYWRSSDIFLGLPFDIASSAMLLSAIAAACKPVRKPAMLYCNFGDLHLYNNHRDQAKEQLNREPRELPSIDVEATWHAAAYELAWRWKLNGYFPDPAIAGEVAV